MSGFRDYICWRDDAVLAITPRDAASLGDGHFQAVHHPIRLRRRPVDRREGGRWVAEDHVVDALQGPLRPDGYLFIPVVGGAGSGKSHLVRWVRDRTKDVPGWEVRYLPKNRTGIRQAIQIVMRGLTGPRIDEAREALAAAPAHAEDDEVAAERLLDELALLVAHADELPAADGATTPDELQLRRKLERELPDLLRDPVVRRKLVAPDAVAHRLVGLAVRGRRDGDGLDDDATRFLESDLPLTFEEIGDTSKGARNLLRQLATIPNLLRAAVALVNDALPLAEKRVAVSGQVDLVEIFREVRRALLAEGKELALFIEDLTVLHGVEREFLDAIVEPARSDDGDMCSLRMIFAVTEGHFDHLDTVRTRCDDAYWLDTPYGEEGVDLDQAVSFLGRYFNAGRLAPDVVESSWREHQGRNWLANACTPCPHQEDCHDTFGASADGYGLYPLNLAAVDRFIQAVSPERFDPRDVLRHVVNHFLLHGAADMRRTAFPSDEALAPFDLATEPLPPVLISELQLRRPADHQRVLNTLRYWSDHGAPTIVKDAVFTAFGLDVDDVERKSLQQLAPSSATSRPARRERSKGAADEDGAQAPETLADRLRPPWRGCFLELAYWPGGQDLSAAATRELRKLIHKTVLANLEVGATPVNLGEEFSTHRFRAERDIGFVGTVTQQSLDAAAIVVDRTEANAAALQGLILQAEGDVPDYPEAGVYRRRAGDCVEQWTTAVTARLLGGDPGIVSAVHGLIVATTIVGSAPGTHTAADFVAAVFEPAPADPAPSPVPRSAAWTALTAQAKGLMPRLRAAVEAEFGESRGVRGGVRAVQADRLLPIIESFLSSWDFAADGDAVTTPLLRATGPAVDAEWTSLEQRVAEAAALVERDRPWPDQAAKVIAVLRAAHNAGRLRDQTVVDELSRLASTRPDAVLRSFAQAGDLVAKGARLPERLAVVASTIPDDVAVVHRFATRATAAIEGVERDLVERQAAAGGATEVEALVPKVLEATRRFAERAKELAE